MRSLVINITDVGADYHVDDEVLLGTPKVRGSSEDPDRRISTAPRRVPLTRGRATVEVEPGKVLARMDRSNVANVFLTTDTYDGGVVSPTNNPWDNLPAGWLMDLQMAWARRQPLPTAGA